MADVLEVRILSCLRPILRIELDGTLEVLERFVEAAAHAERRRHDVVRVIVGRIRRHRALQMVQRRNVIPGVQ